MRKYWCPVCEKPVPADQLAVNVGDKVNITIEHTKITPSRTTVRVVTHRKPLMKSVTIMVTGHSS